MGIDIKYIFKKTWKGFALVFLFLLIYCSILCHMKEDVKNQYEKAENLLTHEYYKQASELFEELGEYKDSKEKLEESRNGLAYQEAERLYETAKFESALETLENLKDSPKYSSDAADLIEKIKKDQKDFYESACNLYEDKKYQEALAIFRTLENYMDSKTYVQLCQDMIDRLSMANPVAVGTSAILAIDQNKTIKTSGNTSLFDFSDWNDIVSVSVHRTVAIGLTTDGHVKIAGQIDSTSVNNIDLDWENIVAVSAGDQYVVGLYSDGTVIGYGHNTDERFDFSNDDWTDIKRIATGWRFTVGLKENGEILVTGFGAETLKKQIESHIDDWTGIVEIAAGGGGNSDKQGNPTPGFIVGLRQDGTVVAVGDNLFHQCTFDPDEWYDIKSIAAGDWHTVGLRSDGTVVSTQPPEDAPNYNGLGDTLFDQCCKVSRWNDAGYKISHISAAQGLTVGVTTDGQCVALGYNDSGKRRDTANNWTDVLVHNLSQQGDDSDQ